MIIYLSTKACQKRWERLKEKQQTHFLHGIISCSKADDVFLHIWGDHKTCGNISETSSSQNLSKYHLFDSLARVTYTILIFKKLGTHLFVSQTVYILFNLFLAVESLNYFIHSPTESWIKLFRNYFQLKIRFIMLIWTSFQVNLVLCFTS